MAHYLSASVCASSNLKPAAKRSWRRVHIGLRFIGWQPENFKRGEKLVFSSGKERETVPLSLLLILLLLALSTFVACTSVPVYIASVNAGAIEANAIIEHFLLLLFHIKRNPELLLLLSSQGNAMYLSQEWAAIAVVDNTRHGYF